MLYIIFGFLTTGVNVGIFYLLLKCNIEYKMSNFFALIISKAFAFTTNKIFVFKTKSPNLIEFFKEIIKFIFARGFTGLVDFVGLIVFVGILNYNVKYSKLFLQVIIIILNYILSKNIVFTDNTKRID